MSIESYIKQLIDDAIDRRSNAVSHDPVLLTVEQLVDQYNAASEHKNLSKHAIYELCKDSSNNGFPCVRMSKTNLLIDKHRFNNWLAGGGLSEFTIETNGKVTPLRRAG